jgi:hypothetical protein
LQGSRVVKSYQRTLSEQEKQQLKSDLPWFGQRRKDRLREIEQGAIDVHEFDIDRVWDINGCRPPCCPHTLLFRTAGDLFVYIETWQPVELQKSEVNERRLRIESTPATRKILKTEVAGEEKIRYTERLREFNELFEVIGDAEWRSYKREELPEQVIAILEAG